MSAAKFYPVWYPRGPQFGTGPSRNALDPFYRSSPRKISTTLFPGLIPTGGPKPLQTFGGPVAAKVSGPHLYQRFGGPVVPKGLVAQLYQRFGGPLVPKVWGPACGGLNCAEGLGAQLYQRFGGPVVLQGWGPSCTKGSVALSGSTGEGEDRGWLWSNIHEALSHGNTRLDPQPKRLPQGPPYRNFPNPG